MVVSDFEKTDKEHVKTSQVTCQIKIFVEKQEGRGEDAPPSLKIDGYQGMLAVFDGLGGAGSTKYKLSEGNTYTGAYIASRLAKQIVEQHYQNVMLTEKKTEDAVKSLRDQLISAFREKAKTLGKRKSRVRSSLLRILPTTINAIYFTVDHNQAYISVVWAGDSRAFLLSPQKGLQQLSKDDVKIDDPHALPQDLPLSNCVSASEDFTLHRAYFQHSLPLILIAATDGCFGFVSTPAHFEYMILDALQTDGECDEWGQRLKQNMEIVAGDDISMSLVALGWDSFADIRKSFSERLEWLKSKISPIQEVEKSIERLSRTMQNLNQSYEEAKEKKRALVSNLWGEYRSAYEALFGGMK